MNQNIAEAAARRHGFRFGNNTSEPITRAVGLRAHQPLHVVDATAGLGRDAFLLASLAAQAQVRRAADRGASLAALGMQARVLKGAAVPTSRAVQMFRRVTQFNTDSSVLTESEIECIQSESAQLLTGIELTDCFANHRVVVLCRL